MKFSQTVGLNVDVSSGGPRLCEVPRRVLDLDPTARRDFLRLLGQAKDIRIGNITIRRFLGLFIGITLLRGCNGALENVRVLLRHVPEVGDGEAKILSDNLKWRMDQPIRKHECGPSSIEVAIVEQ